MSGNPELSKLIDNDRIRRIGQIVISFILIGAMIGYLGYYTFYHAEADFKLALAQDMRVLVIMGVGAALAIFGLGITVGKNK